MACLTALTLIAVIVSIVEEKKPAAVENPEPPPVGSRPSSGTRPTSSVSTGSTASGGARHTSSRSSGSSRHSGSGGGSFVKFDTDVRGNTESSGL